MYLSGEVVLASGLVTLLYQTRHTPKKWITVVVNVVAVDVAVVDVVAAVDVFDVVDVVDVVNVVDTVAVVAVVVVATLVNDFWILLKFAFYSDLPLLLTGRSCLCKDGLRIL